MATGAVKWFDAKKGYGFITPDLGPRDVFVHVSALRRSALDTLAEGERVEFELAQLGDGRLVALSLRPARVVRLPGDGSDAGPGDAAAAGAAARGHTAGMAASADALPGAPACPDGTAAR